MKASKEKINRIIGLDMHPDVFTAAALKKADAAAAETLWVKDRLQTSHLESWARKNLNSTDVVVLEASGNSFEVAHRLHQAGYTALVLESHQVGQIRDNYCNDDRHSAIKLARVYLSGLAKLVWQPDETTRQLREIFFAHRNAVKDATRCRNRIKSYLNEQCVRLPTGTRLTKKEGLQRALSLSDWNPVQRELLEDKFIQLWEAEKRRKRFEQLMVRELIARPQWAQLWRLMGVRHRVAFGLMALIGDISRFPNPKKLVGYLGLSPRKEQSGNNANGRERGIGRGGRGDVRALLIQSAQNAMNQKNSPLHKWGWKIRLKKDRNIAAVAVARKLATGIWYLLKGYFTPLMELNDHLETKLLKIATLLGKEGLEKLGFAKRKDFVEHQFNLIQLCT